MEIFCQKKKTLSKRALSLFVCFNFTLSLIIPPQGFAQPAVNTPLQLPPPGTMLSLSPAFAPSTLKGIKIDPANPFHLDFIVDKGDEDFTNEELKKEATRSIKYFLAALTIPEDDLWVNLSPYEENKIVPEKLGQTDLGRDLLAQDYLLKQLTASLIFPEEELGKRFWEKVYAKARELYGTTEIPVNTFNKVWIIPDKAVVYESQGTALTIDSHLKVMLDEDYLALTRNNLDNQDVAAKVSSPVIREIILPAIETEVNTGKNFAELRQIYNAIILATWFKKTLKESLLGKIYVDQSKIAGVDLEDKNTKDKIYGQYLAAFKKGVYSYIKEEIDTVTREPIPRKYFSGGINIKGMVLDGRTFAERMQVLTPSPGLSQDAQVGISNLVARQNAGHLAMIPVDLRQPNKNPPDSALLASAEEIRNPYVRDWTETQAKFLGADKIEVLGDNDLPRLIDEAVAAGEIFKTADGNYFARSHQKDVARSEERTMIATDDPADAGKYDNWKPASETHSKVDALMKDSLKGKTVYLVPHLMAMPGSPKAKVVMQLTSSRYVAISTYYMTRVGQVAWDALGNSDNFIKGRQVTGDLNTIKRTGDENDERFFVNYPKERAIDSFGSNYGGNVLLGKKFVSLRQAMYDGLIDESLAEHMLILERIDKSTGKKRYLAMAFPSMSGKTTTAFLKVPKAYEDKYEFRVVGDDIAWLWISDDGEVRAVNPENGFFGVIPGVNEKTNAHFFAAVGPNKNAVFTNTAWNPKTGEVWWEDKTDNYPSLEGDGQYWEDWKGQKIIERPEEKRFSKSAGDEWAHPNSRATVRAVDVPNISEHFNDPNGVPIDGFVYGGRVETLEPTIRMLHNTQRGVLDGLMLIVQTTAAAEGKVGMVREDSDALRPFYSTKVLNVIKNRLKFMDKAGPKAPAYFHWNLFRKLASGKPAFPGYDETTRLIETIFDMIDGKAEMVETPIGYLPTPDAINIDGLKNRDGTPVTNAQITEALSFNRDAWRAEINRQRDFLRDLEKVEKVKAPTEFFTFLNQQEEALNTQPNRVVPGVESYTSVLPPLSGINPDVAVKRYEFNDLPPEARERWNNHQAVVEIKNPKLGYTAYVAIHRPLQHPANLRAKLVEGFWNAHRNDDPNLRFAWLLKEMWFGQWTLGGLRIKQFPSEAAAINEVLSLSEAMAYKSALSVPYFGGGKITMNTEFDPAVDTTRKRAAQDDLAKVLEKLQIIVTAVDMNTSDDDVRLMAQVGQHSVIGLDDIPYGGTSASRQTARGTILGMTAAVEEKFPEAPTLEGKTVALQGLGNVGGFVLENLLRKEKVKKVFAADVNPATIERIKSEYAKEIADGRLEILENPDSIYDIEADIFSPNAGARILNENTIGRLKVKIVAGAANIQLNTPGGGIRLHDKGILYVPDYAINSGGLRAVEIDVVGFDLDHNIEEVYPVVKNLLKRAAREKVPASLMADTIAKEIVAKAEREIPSENSPQAIAEQRLLAKGFHNITSEDLSDLFNQDWTYWTKEIDRRSKLLEQVKLDAVPADFRSAFEEVKAFHGRYVDALNSTTFRDQALFAAQTNATSDDVGGINFSAEVLNLQIKRDAKGMPLPLEQQSLPLMQIDGFLPVIIDIKPMPSLPLLLGVNFDDMNLVLSKH